MNLDSLFMVGPITYENRPGEPRQYEGVFSDLQQTAGTLGLEAIDTSTICPDELNSMDLQRRIDAFGTSFINAQIGSQVSRQPLNVALGEGHGSRIIQVVSHIGGEGLYGMSKGPDGYMRSNCGALSHIVDYFITDTEPEHKVIDGIHIWNDTGDGDLNFLGKLYHDLEGFKEQALEVYENTSGGADEKLSATRFYMAKVNLDVQTFRALDYTSDFVNKNKDEKGRLLASELAVNGPEWLYMTNLFHIKYDNGIVIKSFKD
ncbi:MAG: hypothetical protein ACLFP2_01345 [Candidatus Woesearchaeota archaeon]